MCGLPSRNTRKGFALLIFLPLICLGCGDFEAPGSDKSGSIFSVEDIDPVYFAESTRQVDVRMDNCADDPLTDPYDPEPFSDHFADVTLSNRPLNNSDEQTASTVYVQSYELWYEPLTVGAPPLPPFPRKAIGDYVGIEPCEPASDCQGETLGQIEFVPWDRKNVLNGYLYGPSGSCDVLTGQGCQLEYNIYYRFYGENDFGYGVRADGVTNFYASDYDNCGN